MTFGWIDSVIQGRGMPSCKVGLVLEHSSSCDSITALMLLVQLSFPLTSFLSSKNNFLSSLTICVCYEEKTVHFCQDITLFYELLVW